ncbi:MAG: hypothetical protein AAGC99_01430 [Pseudomonadota bacterium]
MTATLMKARAAPTRKTAVMFFILFPTWTLASGIAQPVQMSTLRRLAEREPRPDRDVSGQKTRFDEALRASCADRLPTKNAAGQNSFDCNDRENCQIETMYPWDRNSVNSFYIIGQGLPSV